MADSVFKRLFGESRSKTIMVIGLGRFGIALATTLEERGHEVLAIDADPAKVERIVENLLANAGRHTPAGTPM